jgi:branched-chain amino acid transport system substrate-binding protein
MNLGTNKRKRGIACFAGVALISSIFTMPLASGDATKVTLDPINIGTIMPTTGALSYYGVIENQAIKLAFDLQNNAGGINGHKIVWTTVDSQSSAANVTTCLNQLLYQNNAKLIIGGGASSGLAEAAMPILTAAKVFFASGEADPPIGNNPSDYPYTFQTTLTSGDVVARMMKYVASKGFKQVAFYNDTGAYGAGGYLAATAVAGINGLTVKNYTFSSTATDLTALVQQGKSDGNTAHILWTSLATPGAAWIQATAAAGVNNVNGNLSMAGFTASSATWMNAGGVASTNLLVAAAKLTLQGQLNPKDPETKAIEAFNTAWQKAYASPITIYGAEAWDAAQLAIAALKIANPKPGVKKVVTDGPTLTKAAVKANLVGVVGTYNFSAKSHYGLNQGDIVMTKWDGAKFVPAS